jgi:biopolymer transport protein ExbD
MKMKNAPLFILFFFVVSANFLFAQTKVSGIVVDKTNQPIPYANVVFKDSNIGIVTNEDGRFYIESEKTFTTLIISSVGFSEKEIALDKSVNYNFKIQLNEAETLNEVVVFAGKTSKKK